MRYAFEELAAGVSAFTPYGQKRIEEYFDTTTSSNFTYTGNWCSAFVCWCLEKVGCPHIRHAAAISWLNKEWQCQQVTPPSYGSIVVVGRNDPNNFQAAHVGFFVGWDGESILLLGGNQSKSVSIKTESREFLGAVLPLNYQPVRT